MSVALFSLLMLCQNSQIFYYDYHLKSKGVDPIREGKCVVEAYFEAHGILKKGEGFSGSISGGLGYKALDTINSASSIMEYHDIETRSASINSGDSVSVSFHYRHRPKDKNTVTKVRTGRFSCNNDSGGSGSNCDPNGGGTGGTIFDEISDDTGCVSPILIDLGDDGFAFGGPENPVVFE